MAGATATNGAGGIGRRTLVRTAALLALSATVGAAGAGGSMAAEPLRIVTTTAQVADVVRNVAGILARVDSLMGPGVDPHLYRPTRSDVARLAAAQLVFYNGLHLEGQMVEMLERLGAGKPVIPVTEKLPPGILFAGGSFGTAHDPHVWMDVQAWMAAADRVGEALSAADPANLATYQANRATYQAELAALDRYVAGVLASIPAAARVLVTAHDAFGYLGRRYGLEVVGIQGISTESEAGLRRIEDIVALLTERKIGAVFVETSVSERNVRALIEGAAARGHTVRIGGELYSDAMGELGQYEGTYIGMIDHNATTIARALGGTAPARGWRGRLTKITG